MSGPGGLGAGLLARGVPGKAFLAESLKLRPNVWIVGDASWIMDQVQVDGFQPELKNADSEHNRRENEKITVRCRRLTCFRLLLRAAAGGPRPEYFVVMYRSERARPLSRIAFPTYSSVP